MAHPNEAVWFEMGHRLQMILKKQGRRAERPKKRSAGRELREYLDSYAAERARGQEDVPGQAAGEFLGKVHETYLQHREQLEQQRFQVRGTGGAAVGNYSLGGESSPRAARIVRP